MILTLSEPSFIAQSRFLFVASAGVYATFMVIALPSSSSSPPSLLKAIAVAFFSVIPGVYDPPALLFASLAFSSLSFSSFALSSLAFSSLAFSSFSFSAFCLSASLSWTKAPASFFTSATLLSIAISALSAFLTVSRIVAFTLTVSFTGLSTLIFEIEAPSPVPTSPNLEVIDAFLITTLALSLFPTVIFMSLFLPSSAVTFLPSSDKSRFPVVFFAILSTKFLLFKSEDLSSFILVFLPEIFKLFIFVLEVFKT